MGRFRTQLRPIITSLNGDNCWLWSMPRPAPEQQASGKAYYHIVTEPWFAGPVSVLSDWWIHISYPWSPAAKTVADIQAMIKGIETSAVQHGDIQDSIDVILLGHHYDDHLHRASLLLFDKSTPVVATPEAAALIESFCHFDRIDVIDSNCYEDMAINWRSIPTAGLPSWLTVRRFIGHHELNFVLALVWSHTFEGRESHEAIMISPHGLREDPAAFTAFAKAAEPPVKTLALIHPLKDSHALLVHQASWGADSALRIIRTVGDVKYCVLGHDTLFAYCGAFLRGIRVLDTPRTIESAVEREAAQRTKDGYIEKLTTPSMLRVENGQHLVLL